MMRLLAGVLAALAATQVGVAAARATPSRVVPPPPGARVSVQLGGPYPPAAAVAIVDRDRSVSPAPGLYNVCYFNGFQAQPEERGWWLAHHRDLLLTIGGQPVMDRTWREQLLDVRSAAKRRTLAAIEGRWIDGCARAGYRAVDPDNFDSWSRSAGTIRPADNLAFARLLVARAHARGLAIAQKNGVEVAGAGRRLGFDFAVVEECQAYGECDGYTRAYGRHVIEIEYPDNGGAAGFGGACAARADSISVTLRDRGLVPEGTPGHVEQWCSH